MAGIYIHIPFCKQACTYCNFHFATSLRHKNELVAALLSEATLRQDYLGEAVDTIYIGGGTPSLLAAKDIEALINHLGRLFKINSTAEITLEANPDDILPHLAEEWKLSGINRLSIGVQSFYDDDLAWMNRAHNADQAHTSIQTAIKYFDNITIDLIYGMPSLTNEKWESNVRQAIDYGVPHLSAYALTVEVKTPLSKLIVLGQLPDVNPDLQSEQFLLGMSWLESAGYEHYEISSFAKNGMRSRHNSSYWQQKPYLGIGPSAHSFNGNSRQWNIANNNTYIESLAREIVPFEKEMLTPLQQLNESIMTSLRTKEGLDLHSISEPNWIDSIQKQSKKYIEGGLVVEENGKLILTKKGKLFADGIAADLFIIDL